MELTPVLAGRLVKKLEAIQPYDVVIINADGIIVGATDPCVIGRQHNDAYERICEHRRRLQEGHSPKAQMVRDRGNGRCLFVRNQLVGAVGLSGKESKVTPYLEMAKTIVEMILEREFDIQGEGIRNASQAQVLMRLISNHSDKARLEEVLSAHKIDPGIPRTLLAVKFAPLTTQPAGQDQSGKNTMFQNAVSNILTLFQTRFSFQGDMILPDGENAAIFVFCADRSLSPNQHEKLLDQLCQLIIEDAAVNYRLSAKVVIGKRCCSIDDYDGQYAQLLENFKVGESMFPHLSILHGKCLVLGNITSYIPDAVKKAIVDHTFRNILSSSHKQVYLETLRTYFENNMNIGDTAQSLCIHRNTLQYRFKKIEELTGYCVYDLDDVLTLRLAYLFYSMLDP